MKQGKSGQGKSGSRPSARAPKKNRGEQVRLERLRATAVEAASAALASDARQRTLTRVVAVLVERLGGDVSIPFAEIAGVGELHTKVVDPGKPNASMFFAVAPRDPLARGTFVVGSRVVVLKWAPWGSPEDARVVQWPGVLESIDNLGMVVGTDSGHDCPYPRIVVRPEWIQLEKDVEDERVAIVSSLVSPRVDAGKEE